MNAPNLRIPGFGLWLAAFAALAAIIAWETGWGQRVSPSGQEPQAAPPVTVSLLPEYTIEGGVSARRETVERPAFVPTRRPAPIPVQEVPTPKMARGQFTLTGTAVVDQKQIAFLREVAGGKARTVRAGETINGLTVAEIKPDRVKLTQSGESEELVLKVAAGPRMTVQPPQPGAPQPGQQPGQPARPGTPPAAPVAGTPAPVDSDASILERRRSARALQAQQEAAAREQQQPVVQPPPPPAQPVPPPAPAPAAGATSNAFQDMYRQRLQRGEVPR